MINKRKNFYVRCAIRTLKELNKFDKYGKECITIIEKYIDDTCDEFYPHLFFANTDVFEDDVDVNNYYHKLIMKRLISDLKTIFNDNGVINVNLFELENRIINHKLYSYLRQYGIKYSELMRYKKLFYKEYYE